MRTSRIRVPAGLIRLRPLTRTDRDTWLAARLRNEAALRPVEPTIGEPWARAHTRSAFRRLLRDTRRACRLGLADLSVIDLDGRLVGQLTLNDIRPFPYSSADLGYWVDSAVTGGGVATGAVALALDAAAARGLHRITATVLPGNIASRRVLAHCGFLEEGLLHGAMHMDGAWRDHVLTARMLDDAGPSWPGPTVRELVAAGRAELLAEDPDAPDDSRVYR